MNNVNELILKILKYNSDSDIDEIKVDLPRVCSQGFGNDQEDIGYISYLFKHYSREINIINSTNMSSIRMNVMSNGNISSVENIRNYLIKIAIIRICNQKSIQYQIQNMNDPNYCINLIEKCI